MMRPTAGGGSVDIYEAILLAIAATGPREKLTYDQIRTSLNAVLIDKVPQKLEVSNALNNLASIAEKESKGGDAFEIFIEGYLATQTITQRVRHWVVGGIPLDLRERYKLPNDGTGIDGIYETHDGSKVAYQVKYRQKQQLTFAEVAPFLGITEQFIDRVIFTNAATLSDKAIVRTRWVNGEVFRALSPDALNAIEAWLKQKPLAIGAECHHAVRVDAVGLGFCGRQAVSGVYEREAAATNP
jgi:hypothetical protein